MKQREIKREETEQGEESRQRGAVMSLEATEELNLLQNREKLNHFKLLV